jgi:hypothetical protein
MEWIDAKDLTKDDMIVYSIPKYEKDIDIDKAFKKEFPNITTNLIFQNKNGDYEVFGRYVIKKEQSIYRVYYRVYAESL